MYKLKSLIEEFGSIELATEHLERTLLQLHDQEASDEITEPLYAFFKGVLCQGESEFQTHVSDFVAQAIRTAGLKVQDNLRATSDGLFLSGASYLTLHSNYPDLFNLPQLSA